MLLTDTSMALILHVTMYQLHLSWQCVHVLRQIFKNSTYMMGS